MTVTADAVKTNDKVVVDVEAKATLPGVAQVKKPLFAYAGAVDFVVEQAKELPADVTVAATKVTGYVQTLPTTVRTAAVELADKATTTYNEFAVRGERLVTSIRRQPATQAAIAEGKDALKKAEQATNSAKRAAKATEKATEDAAQKIG